jgi:hypothetical protein
VSWPDDYDVLDLERELKVALDVLTLPIGETARKALIRTVRDDVVVLTDEEREKSDREIEEAEEVAEGPEAPMSGNPPADENAEPVPQDETQPPTEGPSAPTV